MNLLGKKLEDCYQLPCNLATRANSVQLETAYPRPQLRRVSLAAPEELCWICLNGSWKFTFDDTGQFVQPSDIVDWTHTIEVPFAPESARSGIGDTGFHPNCWYEREFDLPKSEGRVLLHFGAIDYRARVWVNGQFMAGHEGGHTPFSIDITPVLNENGVQKVTVWAQDDPFDLAKPRGKQDWQLEPHSILIANVREGAFSPLMVIPIMGSRSCSPNSVASPTLLLKNLIPIKSGDTCGLRMSRSCKSGIQRY